MPRLLVLLLLLAAPAAAQPSPPQILSALVEQAPRLRATDPQGGSLGHGAAVAFVTRTLYELGINAPATGDEVTFTAQCGATDDPVRWACQVVLAVRWGDAESAWMAMFDMVPAGGRICESQLVDGFGAYHPCQWIIAGDRVTLFFAG